MARSRRKGKNSGWKIAAFGIGLLMAAGVIGVIVVATRVERFEATFNRVSGCPMDLQKIERDLSIVFDTTEQLIPSQREEIRNRLMREISSLKENERVRFYRVTSNQTSGISQVSVMLEDVNLEIQEFCKAPLNFLAAENDERVAQNQSLPGKFLDEFIKEVGNEPEAYSPLIDALRYVSATLAGSTTKNNVIVVSDFIENSREFSMYRQNWANTYLNDKDLFMRQRPIYPRNTEIEILLLERPQYSIQDDIFFKFWTELLAGDGSVVINVRRISGGLGGI